MTDKQHLNILAIDDDVVSLYALKAHLEDAHYNITCVKDLASAKSVLNDSNCNYSVILLDRLLGEDDTTIFLQELKQSPAHKHIPVIMITARADRSEVIDAVRSGAFDFVYKPVDPSVLLSMVQRALNNVDMI